MVALRRVLLALGALAAVGVVAAAVLAFVTFGLAPSGTAPTGAPDAEVVASSSTSPHAPASFRDRPVFRSCGRVALMPEGRIPPARIDCLAATPDEGRELVVVSRTAHGDPVVRYLRTGPGLVGIEVFVDGTGDGSGWSRSRCRSGRIDQSGVCA